MNSQNGWEASANRAAIGVTPFVVAGAGFPGGVKQGDVATVLGYVAEQFHRRVEPLVDGWCWGHNYRVISGSSTVSNHGSGTAIDCNAPRHPIGKRGTFIAVQVRAIRQILAECDGAVRWGGDYSRPDGMHFEINAGAAKVAAVARKLRGGGLPSTKEDEEVLKRGDSGGAVWRAQRMMNELDTGDPNRGLKVDGDFGSATENAVNVLRKAWNHQPVGNGVWDVELSNRVQDHLHKRALAKLKTDLLNEIRKIPAGTGGGLSVEQVRSLIDGARVEGTVRLP